MAAAACGGDSKDKAPAADGAPNPATDADAYRKTQQAFADSVVNATRTASQVVDKLGKDYAVGSLKLRDSLGVLSARSECLLTGRKSDPYAAGTGIVDACLNEAARQWKFDVTFGKPGAYITQVQFK